MPQDTPTPDVQADPVSELTGSEDEAAAAFAALDTAPEAETTEPDPADEAADDEATEAEEADPDAEPEADELVEVEADDGKTYKVPPAVQKAMLRQADYSRSMNETAALKKQLEERQSIVETLTEGAEKRAAALAKVQLIDARIKEYDGIDWAKAREDNPSGAALAAVELLTLRDNRKEAAQEAANVARELTESQKQLLMSARNDMDAALRKDLKGWGEELGVKLTAYARASKVQEKTLATLTDPAIVIALEKARRYDELQASKATLKAKAADVPKVAKPGAVRQPETKADPMRRLRMEKTQEAAEAAFLSRMR